MHSPKICTLLPQEAKGRRRSPAMCPSTWKWRWETVWTNPNWNAQRVCEGSPNWKWLSTLWNWCDKT